MAAPAVRPSIVKYLYTHNPFYAISAVLMLYAIRTAYERLGIEASNCWLMTGALAGYTLVLAVIGVWIVRWGKVWEDARSILLMLLVLFLAVSISADDLFVKAETSSTATALLVWISLRGDGFGRRAVGCRRTLGVALSRPLPPDAGALLWRPLALFARVASAV